MSDKKKLKYEKPVSVDMGRVAPILGEMCSYGDGAADCGNGFQNTSIPSCGPTGSGATNWCETGAGAGSTCAAVGSSAAFCNTGSSAQFGWEP